MASAAILPIAVRRRLFLIDDIRRLFGELTASLRLNSTQPASGRKTSVALPSPCVSTVGALRGISMRFSRRPNPYGAQLRPLRSAKVLILTGSTMR